MTSFEISGIGHYESQYPELAAALELPGTSPAPGEIEFLKKVTSQSWRGVGMLTPSDLFFSAAVSSILQPPCAVEIGTASGFSAAILAKMISLRQAEQGRPPTEILVHTIDKKAQFPSDPERPIGFAIDLITPELRDQIAIHMLKDSSCCQEIIQNGDLRFAFIDGNHRHPWPLIDLLRIERLMESGWILLHDVDLPGTIERARAEGQNIEVEPAYGAKHIFDFWPDAKIKAGNIGVIKIPKKRDILSELVAKLRKLPSEVSVGSWTKRWRDIDALIN